MPVRRGFGTVRFSGSLQPPTVRLCHPLRDFFVRAKSIDFSPLCCYSLFWIKICISGELQDEQIKESLLQNFSDSIQTRPSVSSIPDAGSCGERQKASGARTVKPKQSLAQMKGILKVHKKLPLLMAVPTTAGTGSETTLAAVITDAETRHKYAINDFPLIPRYAVLDPKVTLSLPPFVTATTGMDALTHAVEAYIGNSTTHGTRKDALLAVKLIFENIDTAYTNGSDIDARRNMLHASYYAGCAFTKSYVGYVHAVAHSLGGEYNVPHGYANAVLLPYVLQEYGESIHKKLSKLAVAAGICTKETPCEQAANAFIDEIKSMKQRFGIGNTIPQIREEDIPKLAHYADKEANPLYPVPVLMDAEELETFYHILMEEDYEQKEEHAL